jgi:pilus assembly protein Flp/PilA
MRTWLERVRRFLAADDGPTAIEYVVLAALIIAACVLAIGAVGSVTGKSLTNSSESISDALE